MMIFKKVIPRRTFLRGASATLALPLLDSMVPAFAATSGTAAKPPIRLAFVYVPNGAIMDKWTPAAEGAAFEFTPILEPRRSLSGSASGAERAGFEGSLGSAGQG